jgi:hypothetical protein
VIASNIGGAIVSMLVCGAIAILSAVGFRHVRRTSRWITTGDINGWKRMVLLVVLAVWVVYFAGLFVAVVVSLFTH